MSLPSKSQTAILITRPEPGASETAVRVAAMGLRPVIAPCLRIEPCDANLPAPGVAAAVLVTSGNALAACWPALRDTPLLTVGDATAAKARDMGFAHAASAAGDAEALVALAIRAHRPEDGSLLLAVGQGQGLKVAVTLRRAGFRVIRRVVYRSVPIPNLPEAADAALRSGAVRAALFFSAETARAFVRAIQEGGGPDLVRSTEAVSIGPAAAVALRALPWRRIGVAAQPTQDAMLALLR